MIILSIQWMSNLYFLKKVSITSFDPQLLLVIWSMFTNLTSTPLLILHNIVHQKKKHLLVEEKVYLSPPFHFIHGKSIDHWRSLSLQTVTCENTVGIKAWRVFNHQLQVSFFLINCNSFRQPLTSSIVNNSYTVHSFFFWGHRSHDWTPWKFTLLL